MKTIHLFNPRDEIWECAATGQEDYPRDWAASTTDFDRSPRTTVTFHPSEAAARAALAADRQQEERKP